MPLRSETNPGLLATSPCLLPSSCSRSYQFEECSYQAALITAVETCLSSCQCSNKLSLAFPDVLCTIRQTSITQLSPSSPQLPFNLRAQDSLQARRKWPYIEVDPAASLTAQT
ncbi:uncharacterized protein LAESUDRAFT_729606 [Laetiporus sulphureus 93-53]|uniref:Uncharacterized protein n=1 Tax=Laetiporus sulphureus 93-53 TaxID=1314785 RepID=A0A165CMR3_9APHY|nr:uncharacterized protein LAESUDRAFT_729606 [Laetiporus sulphureus 93-53]KZT03094.1 hypothetical protein LAESUDRAFT_729606 [Laetiporus sulphureus 93-53]